MTSALLRRARLTRRDGFCSTMVWLPPAEPLRPGHFAMYDGHQWVVVAISNPITVDVAQAHPGWSVPA